MSAIVIASADVLVCTKTKIRDWFDENDKEILDLLIEKRAAHQDHLAQSSCPVRKATF